MAGPCQTISSVLRFNRRDNKNPLQIRCIVALNVADNETDEYRTKYPFYIGQVHEFNEEEGQARKFGLFWWVRHLKQGEAWWKKEKDDETGEMREPTEVEKLDQTKNWYWQQQLRFSAKLLLRDM